MASRARIDERGRVMIPRADREAALFPPRSDVLVVPKSPGHVELILVGEWLHKKPFAAIVKLAKSTKSSPNLAQVI